MSTLSQREQALFLLLNEIGIISQLSSARLERLLPPARLHWPLQSRDLPT